MSEKWAETLQSCRLAPARKGHRSLFIGTVRLPAMRCKNLVAIDATCLILLDRETKMEILG